MVTTPQEVSLIDAKKGIRMFERVNVPIFGIIENMSYFIAPDTGKKYSIFGQDGGEKLASDMGVEFLGGMPIDPRICEGGDSGRPIVYSMPGSEHSAKMMEIGRNLAAQVSITNINNSQNKVEIVV